MIRSILALLLTAALAGLTGCGKERQYVDPGGEVSDSYALVVAGFGIVETPQPKPGDLSCLKFDGTLLGYGMNWLRYDPDSRKLEGLRLAGMMRVQDQTRPPAFTLYRKRGQCPWPQGTGEECPGTNGIAYSVLKVRPGTYVLGSVFIARKTPAPSVNATWMLFNGSPSDGNSFDPATGSFITLTLAEGEVAYLGAYTLDFRLPEFYPDRCIVGSADEFEEARRVGGPAKFVAIDHDLDEVAAYLAQRYPKVTQPVQARPPENIGRADEFGKLMEE